MNAYIYIYRCIYIYLYIYIYNYRYCNPFRIPRNPFQSHSIPLNPWFFLDPHAFSLHLFDVSRRGLSGEVWDSNASGKDADRVVFHRMKNAAFLVSSLAGNGDLEYITMIY